MSTPAQIAANRDGGRQATGNCLGKTGHGVTLWFQQRYYDQSHSFSIQNDMNIMSLQPREGTKIVRKAEERYED